MQSQILLALNAHPKIGSQSVKKMLAAFDGKPERLWTAKTDYLQKRLAPKLLALFLEARRDYDPETEAKKLNKANLGYVTYLDKEFPPLLAEAPDCPAVLYIKGEFSTVSELGIAIVGSRKYSDYGKSVAYSFAKNIARNQLVVFSGLALGIDSFAHRGAAEEGKTVGVLGCGVDQIYPSSNTELARKILDRGGAIVSEFPPGTPPLKYNFPLRNRIIAGLSLGTVVIEAAESSGALITALHALEYNRGVYAVPGNIDSPSSRGTNKLIQQGAKLVLSPAEIYDDLNILSKTEESLSREIIPETEEEKAICEILASGEKYADFIVAESGLNVITVNTTLTMMEMRGMVVNLGGGRYKKAGI